MHTVGAVTAEESYMRVMRRIAPKVIGPSRVPVTPLPNPVTGPSFHMINMTDRWLPNYSVDFFVNDTNNYLAAFRRNLRDAEGIWRPGKVYRYSNEKLPKGIHDSAVDLEFNSSHADSSKTTPGGIIVLHEMFLEHLQ
ncbi:unnamed protein product [Urochloa humidicola]